MEQSVRYRVGKRLKQARNERGLTMAALAEVLGVTEKSVTNYESGRREPDFATLERISAATGKPLPWFFGAPEPAAPAATPIPAPEPQAHAPPLDPATQPQAGPQA